MIRALPTLILLLLGLAAALIFDGTTGTAITVFLVGTAVVVAVSTVFYVVGRSEDRERERERQR
jgi:ABC-type nickel/cobalt efflux system permease component RcnA